MTTNEIVGRLKAGGLDASSTNRSAAVYVSEARSGRAEPGWFGFRIICDSEATERRAREILSRWYDIDASGNVWRLRSKNRVPLMAIKRGGNAGDTSSPGLRFTMPNGGTITLKKVGSPYNHTFEIRKDETSEWELWEKNGSDFVIDLQAGESVYIRNVSKEFESLSTSGSNYWKFIFTDDVYASGSVMALCVNDKNFLDLTGANYCFYYLFNSCSKLKQAPELPATILAPYCYNNMFSSCSNLNSAPVLPAKKLEERCYFSMFAGCGRLNHIHTNMIDISALECINGWTMYVANRGDFYCPADLTIGVGDNGIPSGWTRHDI